MPSFGVDDDDGDVLGSPNGSSDNEQDENMEDLEDLDGDAEAEGDQDADGDDDDNDDDDEQEDLQGPTSESLERSQSNSQQRLPNANSQNDKSSSSSHGAGLNGLTGSGSTSHPNPQVLLTSPSPANPAALPLSSMTSRLTVRPEVLSASVYDIAPTIAAPHSTSINAVTATPDLRWVFSGGADGYIRKFNWIDTVNGKVMLTVAQRHPFVDSVTKAGVLMSYWENEEPLIKSPLFQSNDDNLSLSPVYSLAVQSEALWLLSGLESGGINLQSVRHDEGKRITCLRQHTSAVSVLSLAPDEKSFLSGSWDKNIFDWDLESGKVKRAFEGSGGQISAIEARPLSSLPVPEESASSPTTTGTLASNNNDPPTKNGVLTNGVGNQAFVKNDDTETTELVPGSPADSLFGGNDGDSLFGDNEDGTGVDGTSAGNAFGDDDNEISRAINSEMHQHNDNLMEEDTDMLMGDISNPPVENNESQNGITESQPIATEISKDSIVADKGDSSEKVDGTTDRTVVNENKKSGEQAPQSGPAMVSESTFLAASINGTLRVWDRRQPNPIATILPRNAPPWCMNACWSPDGNFIYAGRRNGTVEEYSLYKGLRDPERTFKFPQGSGPVSAVRAMPNGKHLVCASFDILRLYDLKEQQAFKHSTVPFLIIPGHRGGVISSLYIDPTCSYLISTAGSRGWEGSTTEVLLGYEIGVN